MHEEYYGFSEKPFSLTPDPKYLYKSESHANAFDLLQYAIRRREGFVVVTGDIGTGKTTLCRAILEQLDRKTFTALVLNPFLSEEDLLRIVLQDFGVVSRDEIKRGRLAGGGASVSFAPNAIDLVHKCTGGIPRLINLVCDRALLGGYSARTNRITPEMVRAAAAGLDLNVSRFLPSGWVRQRAVAFAAGVAMTSVLAIAIAYAVTGLQARNSSPRAADPVVAAP